MKKIACILLLLSLSSGIAIAQSKKEKKQLREEDELKHFEASKALIGSGVFEFKPDWVTTNFDGQRRPVVRSFFRMNNEELYAELPVFLQGKEMMRSSVAPKAVVNVSEVRFEGKVKDYKVKINEKKRMIGIDFKRSSKTERYTFSFTIMPDGSASLLLQPATSPGMTYEGNIN